MNLLLSFLYYIMKSEKKEKLFWDFISPKLLNALGHQEKRKLRFTSFRTVATEIRKAIH